MIYFYLLIIAYFILIIIQIRRFLLKKIINEFVLKALELNDFFIKESKKEVEKNNYDTLMKLHYNTCLVNIFIEKIKSNNKFLFNLKKEKDKMFKELFLIYYISERREYKIDYFLEDIEILKRKDKESQLLRLNSLYYLLMFHYNEKEIKRLFN